MRFRRRRESGPQPHHRVPGPPVEMVLTRSGPTSGTAPKRCWTLNVRNPDETLTPVADFRGDIGAEQFYCAVQGKVWLTFGERA